MENRNQLSGQFTFPGSALTVGRIGYGAMQLAGPGVWGPPRDEGAALAVLQEAVALGVDHIDTSDFYGPHITNRLIRRALHPYPKELVIVTKVGFRRGDGGAWLPAMSPSELERAVLDNLENLGLDALHVVNLRAGSAHAPDDADLRPRIEVMLRLKERGLIRHIGLSNVSLAQYQAVRALAPIACVQNLYNLAQRADDPLLDTLGREGVAYVPFFPLGGFTPLQADALSTVAHELGATPMQVALRWLLARAPHVLLIPGTSSVAHLRENMRAASLTLSAEHARRLDAIGRPS